MDNNKTKTQTETKMSKATAYRKALINREERAAEILVDFIDLAGSCDTSMWFDGDDIIIQSIPTQTMQCGLLGLSAKYPEHVSSLVTHDLNSGKIQKVGDLISTIRIG